MRDVPQLAIVGVTASGKTGISLGVAEHLGADVLCADAMTVYRGMDIGTAKPSSDQRAVVGHHLLDLTDPGLPMTLARFQHEADQARRVIAARGRRSIVVGGSGLYLRALLDGLEPPPTDPDVRARIEALAPADALRRLRDSDPDAFAFIDPANRRRVVRALEVIELTGVPFSSLRTAWEDRAPARVVGLAVSDPTLEARIAMRTSEMFEAGWPEECRALEAAGQREAVLSTNAIGYREVYAFLDGDIDRDEATTRIVRATRKLARKQMTWFRADPRIRWVDADDVRAAAEETEAYLAAPDEDDA